MEPPTKTDLGLLVKLMWADKKSTAHSWKIKEFIPKIMVLTGSPRFRYHGVILGYQIWRGILMEI